MGKKKSAVNRTKITSLLGSDPVERKKAKYIRKWWVLRTQLEKRLCIGGRSSFPNRVVSKTTRQSNQWRHQKVLRCLQNYLGKREEQIERWQTSVRETLLLFQEQRGHEDCTDVSEGGRKQNQRLPCRYRKWVKSHAMLWRTSAHA